MRCLWIICLALAAGIAAAQDIEWTAAKVAALPSDVAALAEVNRIGHEECGSPMRYDFLIWKGGVLMIVCADNQPRYVPGTQFLQERVRSLGAAAIIYSCDAVDVMLAQLAPEQLGRGLFQHLERVQAACAVN
jgi:hypothetical protein